MPPRETDRRLTRRYALLATTLSITLSVVACGDSVPLPSATSAPHPTATVVEYAGTQVTQETGGQEALQEALDAARRHHGTTGAIAVIHIGEQQWSLISGAADATGTPLTAAARFRIGSITKPIIAALALDQVAQGRIGLDEDVSHLVGSPLRPAPTVTLRMLLDHTSGIFDIGNEGDSIAGITELTDPVLINEASDLVRDVEAGNQAVASARLIVALAETQDRYFTPGTGWHYSNTNYQLVGIILEQLTGEPLAELLAQRIARPLDLEDTSLAPADRTSPELRGYAIDLQTGELIDATDDLLAFGNGGSGGIISTAEELTAILEAVIHGDLLPDGLRQEQMAVTEVSGQSYGLGLAVYELECGTFYGHEGRVNGTATIALVDAESPERSAVIALNRSGIDPGLRPLAEQLLCSTHQ